MSRKRGLDSGDGESWKPRRKDKVSETSVSMPTEIVPGVGVDDLPISKSFTSDAIRKYENMPVTRKLHWRMSPNGRLQRRPLVNKISCTAALIQTRGDEVSDRCSNCQNRLGPWEACVIMTGEKDSKFAGSCANCQYSRRRNCTFRAIKVDDFEDVDQEWIPACENEANTSRESSVARSNTSIESEEGGDIRSRLPGVSMEELSGVLGPVIGGPRQSRARSTKLFETQSTQIPTTTDSVSASQTPNPPCSQSPDETEVPPQSVLEPIVKQEQEALGLTSEPSSSATKSTLDTDLVRFPLDPEAFDNLSLLQRAEPVMERHLEVVRKRIRELKAKEQQKESYNPWDFI